MLVMYCMCYSYCHETYNEAQLKLPVFFTVLKNKIIVILNFFSGEESIIHLLSVYLSIYLTPIHKIQYSSLKLEHTDHKMMINVFIQNVLKVIFVFFRSLFHFTGVLVRFCEPI